MHLDRREWPLDTFRAHWHPSCRSKAYTLQIAIPREKSLPILEGRAPSRPKNSGTTQRSSLHQKIMTVLPTLMVIPSWVRDLTKGDRTRNGPRTFPASTERSLTPVRDDKGEI